MSSDKKINIKSKNYWRSLDQLADKPEFKEFLHREFPAGASEMNNDWSRRNFLTLMGASVALAGLAGCRRPKEHIVPYVHPPEEIIPGIPQQYATTMPLGTSSYGIVVESHEGRPTKVEGNKKHPSSLGSTNTWMQAAILGLYDPDRSGSVRNDGVEKTWADFVLAYAEILKEHQENGGEGLAVLSEEYASPTIQRLREKFEKTFPKAQWHTYSPVSNSNIINGVNLAAGREYQPLYHYDKADVIFSVDADFVMTESENVTAIKGFSGGRHLEDENTPMNRLYMIETGFSSTGASADHRLAMRPQEIQHFVVALAQELGVSEAGSAQVVLPEKFKQWVAPLAEDLKQAGKKALVVGGRRQSPAVHALIYAINRVLGANGNTVEYTELKDTDITSIRRFANLNASMKDGSVNTLVMLGGNPVYNAPTDFNFASSLRKVKNSIHLSLYNDETSQAATWHIPMTHFLESWLDARSIDGTESVVQPLIAPLFEAQMPLTFLNYVMSGEEVPAYELVRETWQSKVGGLFEKSWRKVLHDGLLEGSKAKTVDPGINSRNLMTAVSSLGGTRISSGLDVVFTVSPSVYDGSFANNGWLQELPDAVTRLSWDNVAQLSPNTAEQFGFKNEDIITLKLHDKEIELPVWVVPGQADETVVLELGYGREKLGRVADSAGHTVYPLRTSGAPDADNGILLSATGRTYPLATVQDHGSMEGRAIVLEATHDEYKHHPDFAEHAVHHQPLASMWDEKKYDTGYQWGMAIDLTSCTGCNACTIACQSENNVPIIGKQEVKNGREMHWLRLDRYFVADNNDYKDSSKVEMVHQPVACHHCEMAPCEQVCPVAATVHDEEGLNTMVYNRCIGTRYCSNNCPYKVRRFNFFNFTKETPEIVKMAMNPDVTVRSRGVMEKCTYCIQRINRAKIEAKKDEREVQDGEIVSACQQACPANAITFGNINDPESNVTKIKERNRSYRLLEELNTRPRTSYLAKIRNKNPKMPVA